MPDDTIRILRIYEFVGPRAQVEKQVARSIHGTKYVREWQSNSEIVINAVTLGTFPEIITERLEHERALADIEKIAVAAEAEQWGKRKAGA